MNDLVHTRAGSRVAPLGLRFWDVTTRAFVGDGLAVTAFPDAHPRLEVAAAVSASSTWTFHRLPGLGSFERAQLPGASEPVPVDDAFWTNPDLGAGTRPFVLRVEDTFGRRDTGAGPDRDPEAVRVRREREQGRRRFLPFELRLNAPVRDILSWAPPAGSSFPAGPGGALPLFTSPARRPPTGMSVLRLHLASPPLTPGEAPIPAAWALVRASLGGAALGWGLADEDGKATLLFPTPGAPSGIGTPVPLPERTWDLQLDTWYSPPPAGSPVSPRAVLPDVLQQPARALFAKWGPTPADRAPLGPVKLRFGEESIVKSADGKGRLWVA